MKVWRKFTAVALALVMMLALSAVALADTPTQASTPEALTANGVASKVNASDTSKFDALEISVKIPKSITVNGSIAEVYSPTVTYTYSIEEATVADTVRVTDSSSRVGDVRDGVANGVILTDSTAEFSSAPTTTNTQVTDYIVATVDISQFTDPGIYRYEITDVTTETTLSDAGITRGDAADDLFLDVYIRRNETNEDTLEVYGYVLLNANEAVTSGNASSKKVSTLTTDLYQTIDVKVKKQVTGNMADRTHAFSFSYTVTNPASSGFYTATGDATATVTTDLTASFTLAHDQVYHIYGLNPTATVSYTETNNTQDIYVVTIENSGGASGATKYLNASFTNPSGTAVMSAKSVSNYTYGTTLPTATADADIVFTNNLEAISPTGVVLRYAPYFAMMGAGIVALPLSIRRRKEDF